MDGLVQVHVVQVHVVLFELNLTNLWIGLYDFLTLRECALMYSLSMGWSPCELMRHLY